MGELDRLPDTTLVIPLTGELVNLDDPPAVARALDQVRQLKRLLDDARAGLEEALVAESQRQGTRTLHLGDLDAVVSGGEKTVYDEQELMRQLLAAGLPESRVAELVVATVTYKVNAAVARSVASANPDYAAVLERCRRVVPDYWRVSIRKGT